MPTKLFKTQQKKQDNTLEQIVIVTKEGSEVLAFNSRSTGPLQIRIKKVDPVVLTTYCLKE